MNLVASPHRASRLAALDRELSDVLRARGQRVTSQRLVIHRLLRERPRHLTAEEILAETAATLPGTSLPTVYATLELLEELGVVRRVPTGGTAVFDTRPEPHHHALCRRCGALLDLEVDAPTAAVARAAEREGFQPDGAQVTVSGRCAGCSATAGG